MPEGEPPELPPDEAFVEATQQQGLIDNFCQENYPDHQQQCEAMVADRLRGGSQQPKETPDPEPQDPVDDVIMGEHAGDEGIETLVADCVGRGFFGFTKPDMQSCMRVVAKHERDRMK